MTETATSMLGADAATPAEQPAPVTDAAPDAALAESATPAATDAEAQKPAETDKPPAPVAPEVYEFRPPEGQELDAEAVEAFTPLAREMNLSQEQAQKLVDLYTARIGKTFGDQQAKQQAAVVAQHEAWRSEVESDPEIGGPKLKGNLLKAAKAIDTFGGADLRDALNSTGAGSHPAIVRAFIKMGAALAEDGFVRGAADQNAGKSAAEVLYPNHKK